MKKKLMGFVAFTVVMVTSVLFVILYNYVFTPFKGENKDILYSPTEYELKSKKELIIFYHEFLDYEKYEDRYNTEFYFCFGNKSLFPIITLTSDIYSVESYSYVIDCGSDYFRIKKRMLEEFQFTDIPIMLSYESKQIVYESFIDINGTIYSEIHYNYFVEEAESINPEFFRTQSFWFAYNDEKKEIIFSYLFRDINGNGIEREDLKTLIKNSLYN